MQIITHVLIWLSFATLLTSPLVAQVDSSVRHAIVIGIDKYRSGQGLPDLSCAENDAHDLSQALRDTGYIVSELTSKAAKQFDDPRLNPTATYIRDQLDRVLAVPSIGDADSEPSAPSDGLDASQRNAAVVICLHGHGVQLPEYPMKDGKPDLEGTPTAKFFFCAADAGMIGLHIANQVTDRNGLIPVEEIYDRLGKNQSKTRLLIIDACRNDPNAPPPQGFRMSSKSRPKLPPPPGGIAVLLSCKANEFAIEDRTLGHGIFSHFLIEGLKGAADLTPPGSKSDGVITLSELTAFVASSTANHALKEFRTTSQNPEVEGKFDMNLPIGTLDPAVADMRVIAELVANGKTSDNFVREIAMERIESWKVSADRGSANAQFFLAKCYAIGAGGCSKDEQQSVEWTRKAALQGHALAQNNLGTMYVFGNGVAKDLQEALRWNRLAAASGLPIAINNLAIKYREGMGVPKDAAEAHKLSLQAAETGFLPAVLQVGLNLRGGIGCVKNETEGHKWIRKAAEAGHAHAQVAMGFNYAKEVGTPKDDIEAAKWYRRAAEHGDAEGERSLAYCYENGFGVAKDPTLAAVWYRKAADQNNASAQYSLGFQYAKGKGVEKDLEEAVRWYRKAADQGNPQSQFSMGHCCENGMGIDRDLAAACLWYSKAVEQGNQDAGANLGRLYLNGIGIAKDVEKAVSLFKSSADKGNAASQNNLAYCYSNGIGVAKDLNLALKLYRQAADQGQGFAQRAVGGFYERGEVVAKDIKEAVRWYEKSAEQGDELAKKSLDRLRATE
jgi:TPR repeat protein/uncharacterized caspase-like protein